MEGKTLEELLDLWVCEGRDREACQGEGEGGREEGRGVGRSRSFPLRVRRPLPLLSRLALVSSPFLLLLLHALLLDSYSPFPSSLPSPSPLCPSP